MGSSKTHSRGSASEHGGTECSPPGKTEHPVVVNAGRKGESGPSIPAHPVRGSFQSHYTSNKRPELEVITAVPEQHSAPRFSKRWLPSQCRRTLIPRSFDSSLSTPDPHRAASLPRSQGRQSTSASLEKKVSKHPWQKRLHVRMALITGSGERW